MDTESEYTWVPVKILQKIGVGIEKKDLTFRMANGQQITRNVGFAIIRFNKHFTIDEVVFAEPGDLTLLGARTLEGLSLVVDPQKKKLVAAGPNPGRVIDRRFHGRSEFLVISYSLLDRQPITNNF